MTTDEIKKFIREQISEAYHDNQITNKAEINRKIYNIDNWLGMHVQQLSYLRNLIIVLTLGALGYTVSLFDSSINNCYKPWFVLFSVVYLLLLGIGFWISYNESENYRKKNEISRKLVRNPNFDFKEIEKECTRLEKRNSCLIKIHIVMFMIVIVGESILLMIIK